MLHRPRSPAELSRNPSFSYLIAQLPMYSTFTVKNIILCTAQKMKFSIEDFFSKCDEIHRKLRIWSHLLKKSLTQNFIFCAMSGQNSVSVSVLKKSLIFSAVLVVFIFCLDK